MTIITNVGPCGDHLIISTSVMISSWLDSDQMPTYLGKLQLP